MFAKLLKHELKSTGGLLGILSPAALAVGVIGGFLLRGVVNMPATQEAMEASSLLAGLLLPFVFISLFAYAFGGEIYLVVQFYKRKFTDQGYLTFTLPVSTWQIYLSSLLNMLIWTIVIGVVTFASFAAMSLIAIYDTEGWYMMWNSLKEFPVEIGLAFREFGAWGAAYGITAFVSSNVLLITCVTLGCITAKKHKILASVGWYYLSSTLLSAAVSFVSFAFIYESEIDSLKSVYMSSAAVYAAVAVAGSVLTIWLMDRKLNLP